MSKQCSVAVALIALSIAPGSAQDSAGVVPQRGASMEISHALVTIQRTNRDAKDGCWKLGCLVIVNETRTYNLTGFYSDESRDGTKPQWSRNQLRVDLEPMKATLRFKSVAKGPCDRAIRLVLTNRHTHDNVEMTGSTNFCSTPHANTLLRVKMLTPEVILGDGPTE